MIKVVGLTGGIGSGKSTVAHIIRAQGVPVIDADQLAREIVEPGLPAHADIAAAWPEVIGPDGHVDRKKLATLVFGDETNRLRLEAITHARIRERIDAEVAELARAGHGLVFVEAALLVETGSHERYDGLVVVAASEEAQLARVVARDGCTREAALARLRAQRPLADKIRAASHVIDNQGDLHGTRTQTLQMLQDLTG
jgi:dephospho-CoA kinase